MAQPFTAMLNLNLTYLIDDAKCYETVRQICRQVLAAVSASHSAIKRGKDDTEVSVNATNVKTAVLTSTT